MIQNPLHIYVDTESQKSIIEEKAKGIYQLKKGATSFNVSIKEYEDLVKRHKEAITKAEADYKKKIKSLEYEYLDYQSPKDYADRIWNQHIKEGWTDKKRLDENYYANHKQAQDKQKELEKRKAKEADAHKKKTDGIKNEIKKIDDLFKDVVWIYQLAGNNLPQVVNENSFNEAIEKGRDSINASINDLDTGGGFVYVQPYIYNKGYIPEINLQNGAIYFKYSDNKPEIKGAGWYKDNEGKEEIITPVKYGSTVYLLIKTKDLYGQLVTIEFKDDDSYTSKDEENSTDDDLGIYPETALRNDYKVNNDIPATIKKDTQLQRMVSTFEWKTPPSNVVSGTLNVSDANKHDGKSSSAKAFQGALFAVYIDPFWSKEANVGIDESEIEVFPTVSRSGVETAVLKSATLKVSNEGTLINPSIDRSNKPLLMGEVDSDYTNLYPCRFDKVTAKYDRGEEKFETQVYPLKDIPKPTKLIFPIVAGVKQAVQDFTIELEGVKTDNCNFEGNKEKDHTGHVIDISKIKELIKNGRGKPSKKWRGYEYKDKSGIKNEQANDENDDSNISESNITHVLKFRNGGSEIKMQESYKVLEDYTPFTLEEPTDEKLELQVGYDFTWNNKVSPLVGLAATIWPNNEYIAQKIPVALRACYPNLPLDIMVYPDTKWTLQLAFNYDAEEFEELREAYHDKWAMEELKAKDDLEKLKKREEGIPDAKYLKKKKEREKAKRQREAIRKSANKAKNKKLKAKKKMSKMSQAKHMMRQTSNTKLIDCEFTLMCEFDRPYQALNFTSACDRITAFLHKIGDLKELVNNIINGKDEKINRHSPKEQGKQSKRKVELQKKLDNKKAKSNWSFEFIPPSVGLSLSWYAENPKDLNTPVMGTMIEGAIDLDPLFGFEIKYDVYQLLYKIKHPAVLAVVATLDILDEALEDNFDINLDLIITSEISGSLKGTINTAEGSSYKERLMKDEDDTPCKFGGKVEISLKGYVQANGDMKVFVFWRNRVYIEMSAEVKTGISIECVTKADEHSIYVEPEIKFEGLLLEGQINIGFITDDAKANNIDELKELDGIHYTAEGKIVVLDPYEWETGWKLPIMKF